MSRSLVAAVSCSSENTFSVVSVQLFVFRDGGPQPRAEDVYVDVRCGQGSHGKPAQRSSPILQLSSSFQNMTQGSGGVIFKPIFSKMYCQVRDTKKKTEKKKHFSASYCIFHQIRKNS